ncbi:hypothetical protein [Pedobacter cryoconitis]|uniref:hypothetical protein n=1 Tax=Pedobacter cryoconitis TaxID=188932 RepID=UPI001618B5AA|nr:hypothetical protein [Pedobacter cryoconitis]MBB5649136.1 hypothetical protein [Pedobacter cryoconitis]
MKYIYLLVCSLLFITGIKGQTVSGPAGYQVISLGDNGIGDFTSSLILLHEAYNGTLLPFNNAVGTITAYRGNTAAYQRVGIANVNTSSAYGSNLGSLQSYSGDLPWKLKTCIYKGKKYMALEVPYAHAYHNWGYQFSGWTNSSAENLKVVSYMVKGVPINQDLISDIQDFDSNITETNNVKDMNLFGNLNIGTDVTVPGYQLQVKGKIRSQEIKVEMDNWPDYVFEPSHEKLSLTELESFIKTNKHLPEIPSVNTVIKDGINLGDMNAKLLKKIEELTLYVIELKHEVDDLKKENKLK